MEIRNHRFLITGGAGLMGSHITERVLAKGASEVILLDNFVRGSMHNIEFALKDPRVRLVKGDIRDLDLLRELATGVDGIFHMAALRITACADNPREAMEVMLVGTHNVLQTVAEQKVGRLVYASSASVYGLADVFPTSESHHAFNNRTLYGTAKMAGEGMARSFADMYGIQYVALRYFNVYGPRMDIHGRYTEVLVRWLDRIGAGRASCDFRRWLPDDGPRVYRRCDGCQYHRDGIRDHRRGVQRRQRDRDKPPGAPHGGPQGNGICAKAGVSPRSGDQSGSAAAGRHQESGGSRSASRQRSV